MQATGIFDPVMLRQEYDAYLIGTQDWDYQEEPNEYKKGGSIHINPANKGKFNATKKRTGKTTEELTHSKNPLTRKRAIFAQNAKKWHHKDDGGYLDDIIWDNMGQWNHPGQITGITGTKNGTDITMDGVADYLIGKDNLGNVKFMKPGMDYHFTGSSVVEYPLKYQFGGLFKKKPETNYLYATYGIDTPYNNVSVSPVKTDYFGLFNSTQDHTFNPVQDNIIGRDYNMPDYNAQAIVQAPMYMNEQPIQQVVNALNPVTLRNRQMYAESTGNPRAKSHAGAQGLFQIMPDTLKWYQGKTNDYGDVNDPVYNERVRDWLMNWIFDRPILKRDDIDDMEKQRLAYAAYNGGYGTVSKAYNKYGSDWINHVPKESRDYALFIVDGMDTGGGRTNKAYDDWYNNGNEYIKQYGGLIRPFSYTDIPVVRYGFGGYSYI